MSQNGHKPWLLGPGVYPGSNEPDDSWKLIAAVLRLKGASRDEALNVYWDELLPETRPSHPMTFCHAAGCGYSISWVF